MCLLLHSCTTCDVNHIMQSLSQLVANRSQVVFALSFFFFTAIRMDKVWKSKEKAQMTNLQEGQLHAAQLEDGPLFGPMFVGMS